MSYNGDVIVRFRDGTKREFKARGRAGGSYHIRVTYEPGVVMIVDEYDEATTFPIDLVAEINS